MMTSVDNLGARRWWALGPIALGVLMIGLDLTVLNLALPTLALSLHASTGDLQWIADSYSLALAAALLPAGLLGDRFGRKKFLMVGLVLFGASSVACAYASSAGVLIAARVALGLGAAVIIPLSLSVLPALFSERERPRAIALVAGAAFVSYPAGPILGGWLLTHYWWGSVFLINVPVVVIALIAVALLLPESRGPRHRPDLTGMLISSVGLVGVTYGIVEAGQSGWRNSGALSALAAGILVVLVFLYWERRFFGGQPTGTAPSRQPLLDLTLFRSASFTWATILATFVSFAIFGILFAMPLYFQEVRGVDALGSGLRLLPLIGGLVVGMMVGDRRARPAKGPALQKHHTVRGSAKMDVATGLAFMAAGLFVGAFTGLDTPDAVSAIWFVLTGVGFGLAVPAAMNAALGALAPERSGVGSAVISALRQVGATLGVAVLGTVLNTVYRGGVDAAGLPPATAQRVRQSVVAGVGAAQDQQSASMLKAVRVAFVDGLDVMLWVCASTATAAVVLALVFLPHGAGSASAEAGQPERAEGDGKPATVG
jgi:EmrB/QacA subfamily drug resistance transporter